MNTLYVEDTAKLTLKNAKMIFRNFSGKPTQYNAEGKRSFCVFIDEQMAEQLRDDHWNVKELKRIDPEDQSADRYYINIALDYDEYHEPPRIIMYSGKTKSILDERKINLLDYANIERCDLFIKGRNYGKRRGIGNAYKGHLSAAFIWVNSDESDLEAEYDAMIGLAETEHPTDDFIDEEIPF